MPYLSTSQEYLEQSALLLQAYPDTTRITTKYTYPSSKKSSTITKSKPSPTDTPTTGTQSQTQSQSQLQTPTPATLTLKTFHPHSGICLKYRTNKAAEVGRLISGLGKLASGAPVVETALAGTTTPGIAGDVEMVDASTPASTPVSALAQGNGAGAGAGEKGPSGGRRRRRRRRSEIKEEGERKEVGDK
ncbi:hypothetical protein ACJ72_01753 [Emergomyces africanus]|uniref:SRP9 domain-containing protein n=1 Tax=Emergomyces africanus TaxID=1955775 RepID=A0A1B7P4B5_9EURO|nr:hypothetical protein ACJ72_01753 [Emergomyces africanus]